MWVRGLKPLEKGLILNKVGVAPYVGAWIETLLGTHLTGEKASRTLCGCVD